MAKKALDDLIGPEAGRSVEITIWIPNKDRDGNPRHDQNDWKEKALRLLAKLFGKGATAMAPCDGAWLNPKTKQLVREEPIMVFCYVTEEQVSQYTLMRRVIQFCRDMGKTMCQGEVAIKIGDRFILIDTF